MPLRVSTFGTGIALAGELDMETVPVLERAVSTYEIMNGGGLVVDLRELTFMDSTGLRALLRPVERTDGAGVLLRGARGEVARVIELTGVGRFPGIQIDA